jgi:inhibitor of KinA sporulation pathway (predicted exonuclease)
MNYCVLDLEATCFENNKDHQMEIIEIGAVIVDENWNEISEFNSLVCPLVNPMLSEFCTQLTHITQSDVDNADTFPKVIERFKEWVEDNGGKGSMIFCSWGKYDYNQLKSDCNLHQLEFPFQDIHINLKNVVATYSHSKRKGVVPALNQFGLTFEGTHHRGLDDTKNILRICRASGLNLNS